MNGNSYYPSKDPIVKLKQEMKLRNFSQKTITSYLYYTNNILKYANKGPKMIRSEDVREYLVYLAKNRSASTLNIVYSALKFYFEKILRRKFFVSIPRAKQDKKLPVVLSRDEVGRMIEVINNPKHKFLIQLLYSSGMRISEVVKLKMSDIDFDRSLILIRGAKGRKDRYTLLAKSLVGGLEAQRRVKDKDDYLFTSRDGRSCWSTMSAEKVIKEAANKASIGKNVSAHTLRHSFATHLLEQGTDIRYIQELLGHSRLETTQIYTKVAQNILVGIKNPLD